MFTQNWAFSNSQSRVYSQNILRTSQISAQIFRIKYIVTEIKRAIRSYRDIRRYRDSFPHIQVIYFTITEARNIVRYTSDFVI